MHAGNSKLRLSRVLLGWLLFAGSPWAQTPLYLDLSGDWRRGPTDDVSLALAALDVDDSQWPVLRLPLAQQLLVGQQASVEASGFFIDPVYQPALEVGGDLYQILERPGGRTLVRTREIAEAAKAWGQNDDITVVTARRAG